MIGGLGTIRCSLIPTLVFMAISLTGGRHDLPAFAAAARWGTVACARPDALSAPAVVEPERRLLDTIVPGLHTFLEPNAPNPFQSYTRIGFTLPHDGIVTLKIYDFWYRPVVTLVNGQRSAGRHIIDFVPGELDPVPDSGMYFYELRFGGERFLRRMLLI